MYAKYFDHINPSFPLQLLPDSPCHRAREVQPPLSLYYMHGCGAIHWNMATKPPGAASLKTADSLFQQSPTVKAPQLGARLHKSLP